MKSSRVRHLSQKQGDWTILLLARYVNDDDDIDDRDAYYLLLLEPKDRFF